MPAVSKAQQALMGMALSNPGKIKKKNKGVLNMSQTQLEDFASTPTKGLPKRAPTRVKTRRRKLA